MGVTWMECVLDMLGDDLRVGELRGACGTIVVLSVAVSAAQQPWDNLLTAAERDVAARVLRGQSNSDVARARGCSPRTVANQVASVFRKLGVASRAELAAVRGGMTSGGAG